MKFEYIFNKNEGYLHTTIAGQISVEDAIGYIAKRDYIKGMSNMLSVVGQHKGLEVQVFWTSRDALDYVHKNIAYKLM